MMSILVSGDLMVGYPVVGYLESGCPGCTVYIGYPGGEVYPLDTPLELQNRAGRILLECFLV